MNQDSLVYVSGHNGMVGSAILRILSAKGYENIATISSEDLDLREQDDVDDFIHELKPEYVFLAAGKVGGIHANNTLRAEFIYDNLMIQTNIIHSSFRHNVKKLLCLGSSCIYPKNSEQPISENMLLSGKLEPTNEPYAISKIAAIKMCDAYRDQYGCNFISAMPTNLYGPNDNYDLLNSHVLPALLRKFIEAKRNGQEQVEIWGTGAPRREFMHVDDMASAALFLMHNYDQPGPINVGTGKDISILELAQLIKEICGFKGSIVNDLSKPDGMMLKRLDVGKINALGWSAMISLEEGIKETFKLVEQSNFDQHDA